MNNQTPARSTRSAPTLIERARILLYLERVDMRLSIHDVGWSQRRRIGQELKSNVLDAATNRDSLSEAFAALGTPRELAKAYADADVQRGFRPHAAAVWTLVAFAILQVVGLAISVGFREGADAAGADQTVSYALELANGLGPFAGSYTPGPTVMAQFTLLTPTHLVVMLAAAMVGGRVWRLLPRS